MLLISLSIFVGCGKDDAPITPEELEEISMEEFEELYAKAEKEYEVNLKKEEKALEKQAELEAEKEATTKKNEKTAEVSTDESNTIIEGQRPVSGQDRFRYLPSKAMQAYFSGDAITKYVVKYEVLGKGKVQIQEGYVDSYFHSNWTLSTTRRGKTFDY